MDDKMKGIRLFYFWVFGPCARLKLSPKESRSYNGKISQPDFDWMQSLANIEDWSNVDIDRLVKLFKVVFTNAYDHYLAFMRTKKGILIGELWSYASVAMFWHKIHTHPSPSENDVYIGNVCRLADGAVIVLVGDRQLPMENCYNLPVSVHDMVYIHNNVLVEICEPF